MTLTKSLLCGLAALVLVQTALAVDKVADAKKDADLKLAATALERMNILSEDSDWVYDFNTNPLYSWAPGSVLNANAATFPAATGYGLTVALLNLGPCSMLPPHLHPRATNFVVAVNGTTETYMIQENGARTIKQTLKQGQLTIFPAGSLHTMQNKECTNTQLVSALNSDDTGTHNVANGLFSLPNNFLQAAFGNHGYNFGAMESTIPPVGSGSIYGDKECLRKCRAQGYKV